MKSCGQLTKQHRSKAIDWTSSDLFAPEIGRRNIQDSYSGLRFIDLFAGMGGIRLGFEQAAEALGLSARCVFTSEIKPTAIKTYQDNFPGEFIAGDLTKIDSKELPEFDVLLAGFPCQAFSSAGKRDGFVDTRGTLFFEIERILKEKQPQGFLLENVEGLVNHDKQDPNAPIGRTLATILDRLKAQGYFIDWGVLNAVDFGVPQERKRIYILGSKKRTPTLPQQQKDGTKVEDIIERGLPTEKSSITMKLLECFDIAELYGRSLKDKRGGSDNIHSWDIGLKGEVSSEAKELLNQLLKERRKKKWAIEYGIEWMDGMPLSYEQIASFSALPNLRDLLDSLVSQGYLKREYPKKIVSEQTPQGVRRYRQQDTSLPLGYNIVTGKLSLPISKILDPNSTSPTLVATDMDKLYVVDGGGLRPLSIREGLRLSGYPEHYQINLPKRAAYDLLGNTVVVPVVRAVAKELIKSLYELPIL